MDDLTAIFLLETNAGDALWEHYHGNTRIDPLFMPPKVGAPDPVADLNASLRLTSIAEIEAAVGSGGKRYATAETLKLPEDLPEAIGRPLAEVLAARASRRAFGPRTPSLDQLAALARVACGRNERRGGPDDTVPFRYTPSAGALYPLELYFLTTAPLGQADPAHPAEVWHYEPQSHRLERIHRCQPRDIAVCFQTWPDHPPPVVALFTGVPKRQTWKYGARGYRYTLLEAGHAAQNLLLAATALDMSACPIVGYYDDALHDLLDIDGVSEVALYTVFLGLPAPGDPHDNYPLTGIDP